MFQSNLSRLPNSRRCTRIPVKALLREVGLIKNLKVNAAFPPGGMMMTTEDSMQYDESYGAYEEGYDEGAYYQEGGQETAGGAGMESFVTLTGL